MGCCCRKPRGKNVESAKPLTKLNTKVSFEDVVGTDRLIVIDCYATWCGPCTKIAPKVEKMAIEFADTVEFYKMDVDVNAETAASLEIHAMPTFVVFAGGSEVARIVGADLDKVRASIYKYSRPGVVPTSSRKISNATRSSISTARIMPRKETIVEVPATKLPVKPLWASKQQPKAEPPKTQPARQPSEFVSANDSRMF